MQVINKNFEEKKSLTEQMRELPIKSGFLPIRKAEKASAQAMASKLKKKEGLIFLIQKSNDLPGFYELWRTGTVSADEKVE